MFLNMLEKKGNAEKNKSANHYVYIISSDRANNKKKDNLNFAKTKEPA